MTDRDSPLRVAVIGARRVRQGIGEFVARWFAHAGAEVCAVIGSSEHTAREAASKLKARYDIDSRPFATLSEALGTEQPDAVAICSPHASHREHLQRVAEHGVHCLCEKPMWWPETASADITSETASLVDAILDQDRVFGLITQWPCTLPGFFRLYPQLSSEPVESFEMELGPVELGPRAVLDSVPHVISMLHALSGPGVVSTVRVDSEPGVLVVSWRYQHAGGEISTTCRLVACPEPPRPAAYSINGCRADRRIELPDYTILLEGAGQKVPLEDPLAILIRQFMDAVGDGRQPSRSPFRTWSEGPQLDRRSLIESMTSLECIHESVKNALGDSSS